MYYSYDISKTKFIIQIAQFKSTGYLRYSYDVIQFLYSLFRTIYFQIKIVWDHMVVKESDSNSVGENFYIQA